MAVLPVVTLYVREMLGVRPDIATLGGLAFSATGLAGVLAVPFLGKRSDRIGYRRTLLICLFGAALFTLPMALPLGTGLSWSERFGLGAVRRRGAAGVERDGWAADRCRRNAAWPMA